MWRNTRRTAWVPLLVLAAVAAGLLVVSREGGQRHDPDLMSPPADLRGRGPKLLGGSDGPAGENHDSLPGARVAGGPNAPGHSIPVRIEGVVDQAGHGGAPSVHVASALRPWLRGPACVCERDGSYSLRFNANLDDWGPWMQVWAEVAAGSAMSPVRVMPLRPPAVHQRMDFALGMVSRVAATVTDESGVPLGGALVLISSLPSARPRHRMVLSDADGAVHALIGPGRVTLQARRADGAFGAAVGPMELDAGQRWDAGILVAGAVRPRQSLAVADALGPVENAWVRLAEPALRFAHDRPWTEDVHLLTDRAGRVVLPPLSEESVPFQLAVASMHHHPVKLFIEGAGEEIRHVELRFRPGVSVRLVDPKDGSVPAPGWTVVAGRSAGDPDRWVSGDAVLDTIRLLHSGPHVDDTGGPTARIFTPNPGPWEIECHVPGGLQLRRTVLVPAEFNPGATPEQFLLPAGRPVRLVLQRSGVAPTPTAVRARWLPLSEVGGEGWFDCDLGEGLESPLLWAPASAASVELYWPGPATWPWGRVLSGALEPLTVVDLPDVSGVVGQLRLVLEGDGVVNEAAGVPITIIATDGNEPREAVHCVTNDRGQMDAALPAGRYRMILQDSGVAREFSVRAGEETRVRVPWR